MKKRILGLTIAIVGLVLIVVSMYMHDIPVAQFSVFFLLIGIYLFIDKQNPFLNV